MGVWLFYVQHQFEETHWAEDQDWKAQEAALHGSSHYDLPPILQWITANIGSTMSITWQAEFRITGCRKCCATTPS
jgi:hypothetical protein